MYKLFFGDVTQYYDKRKFKKGYNEVCKYRKKKIDALKNDEDKARSLAAGILFEEVCDNYGLDKKLLDKLCDNEHGKPYFNCSDFDFPNGQRLYFSISHSGHVVLIGVADSEIGVDIQKIEPLKSDIVSRCLTADEQDAYYKADNDEYLQLFYKIWCLKESYGKYTGKGLGEGFASFSTLKYLKDSGIWQDEYAYAVTIEDYRKGETVLNVETVKPKSKLELAKDIIGNADSKKASAPIPKADNVLEKEAQEKTPVPVAKPKETVKVSVENTINHEEYLCPIPSKVTFVNKKKDVLARQMGVVRCKHFRARRANLN